MNIALVNTNRIKPPIAPIGLEYVAEALYFAEHHVEVLDLCWEDDGDCAIEKFFHKKEFLLIGVTLRNTDDCAFMSRQSFLNDFIETVKKIRKHTKGLIVLGGIGFSVMPEYILGLCNADAGIWGEGEFVFVDLAKRIAGGKAWQDLPNLIYYRDKKLYRNAPFDLPRINLPLMRRCWVDNQRYFREGGQIGIETKRGCPCHCIYCADPIAKGAKIRTRSPKAVADELEMLLQQGIDHIHTCDSEFNLPIEHASEVCNEIMRRGLAGRLRWYAYCSPLPFSLQLAKLMYKAGCVGINFGVDSGDEKILRRLKRDFTPHDILQAVRFCKEAGILVMLDLLIGSPGETEESIARTIELMKVAKADRIGVAVGVRVYPGTELEKLIEKEGMRDGCIGGNGPFDPLFFLEPKVASSVFHLLDKLIGEDKRYFFFDPSRPTVNYNYNANQVLVDAIGKGYRGAYWDILRRCE